MSVNFRVDLGGQNVQFRFQNVSFAGIREIVSADVSQDIAARAAKAANLSDLASVPTAQNNLGVARVYTFRALGNAVGDGATDDATAVQAAITAAVALGVPVTLDGEGRTYLLNTAGVTVNADHIHLTNFIFKRTSTTTGWLCQFASTADTVGGGVTNARFIGLATVAGGNAGLRMGSETYAADDYTVHNVTAENFAQYGVGIEAGDRWKINNVRVKDHGLTSGTITSCMGFYLFPRIASTGGQLSNLFSEISAACQANVSANTAAVKLQTHQNLLANNITAIGGSEQAMSIDSVEGLITQVIVRGQDSAAGLALTNYNTAHSFSGQTFTLDGFEVSRIDGSASSFDLCIGSGVDAQYALTGCTIKNGHGGGAAYLIRSNMKDCVLDSLDFEDIRFDCVARSITANSAVSTNNVYRAVTVRGGTITGVLYIEATESIFEGCGGAAVDADTIGGMELRGSSNVVLSPFFNNVSGNAVKVTGSSNQLFDITLGVVTGRSIWFPSGSDTNTATGNLDAGTGVLDSGSGNRFWGSRKTLQAGAKPTTGTHAVGDFIASTGGPATGVGGWGCASAGTPGQLVEARLYELAGATVVGDAAATLVADRSSALYAKKTNIWNTPLTADRAVTLGTSGALTGDTFRITRTAAATGAFNLNVGTGPLKALAAGEWCDVTYNGSAFVLTGAGTL